MRIYIPTLFSGVYILSVAVLSACATSTVVESNIAIHLPPDKPITIRNTPTLALSPDGRHLVYPADTGDGDTRLLYLHPLNGQGRFLPGTMGAETPFFSPDGRWIGFFADGKLKKLSIDDGDIIVLSDAPVPAGGYWAADNTIVYSSGPLWRVSAGGGIPRQITRLESGEKHNWPTLLPGGKQVMYNLLEQGKSTTGIIIEEIESGKRWNIIEAGSYPKYTVSGHLIYTDSGALMAAALDLTDNSLKSAPESIIEGILMSPPTGAAQYDISANGRMVYVPGGVFGQSRRVVMFDREGNERDPGLPLNRYSYVRYSPDGRYLALEIEEEKSSIWIHDLEQNRSVQLINEGEYPVWSRDGLKITFSAAPSGIPGIYQTPAHAALSIEELVVGKFPLNHSYDWSADGRALAYTEINPDTGMDIWLLDPAISNNPVPVMKSGAEECCAVFSPDRQWLAYVSDQSGRAEVYIIDTSDYRDIHRLSNNGGREPIWSHSGRELYYWQDRQLMAVDVSGIRSTIVTNPRSLLEGIFVSSTSTWRPRYDIHPDDNEFVILRRGPEEMGVSELRQLSDFIELLNR